MPASDRVASGRRSSRAGIGRPGGGRTRPRPPARSERLPGQVLAPVPAARRAGHPLPLQAACLLPFPPRMPFRASLRNGFGLDQLAAARLGERAGHADALERARVVVQPEQQRADHRARPVLVPAEAGHDAVRRALVLDLDHLPLAGQVAEVAGLRDHPVQPAPSKTSNQWLAVFGSVDAGVRWTDAGASPAAASAARRSANGRSRRSRAPSARRSKATPTGSARPASRPGRRGGSGAAARRSSALLGGDDDLAVEHERSFGFPMVRSGSSSSGKYRFSGFRSRLWM